MFTISTRLLTVLIFDVIKKFCLEIYNSFLQVKFINVSILEKNCFLNFLPFIAKLK